MKTKEEIIEEILNKYGIYTHSTYHDSSRTVEHRVHYQELIKELLSLLKTDEELCGIWWDKGYKMGYHRGYKEGSKDNSIGKGGKFSVMGVPYDPNNIKPHFEKDETPEMESSKTFLGVDQHGDGVWSEEMHSKPQDNIELKKELEVMLSSYRTAGSIESEDFSPVFFFESYWEYDEFLDKIASFVKRKLPHLKDSKKETDVEMLKGEFGVAWDIFWKKDDSKAEKLKGEAILNFFLQYFKDSKPTPEEQTKEKGKE